MVRFGETMMTSYILSASLAIGTPSGVALPDRDAIRYAAKAIVRELNWDKKLSKFEKKHIGIDNYPELKYIGIIARIGTERRITWRWEF